MLYAQIHRFRNVSTALKRQQTKWVVFSLTAAIVSFIGHSSLYALLPSVNELGVPAALYAHGGGIYYALVFLLVPVAHLSYSESAGQPCASCDRSFMVAEVCVLP